MGVLIHEFEIVPAEGGDTEARAASTAGEAGPSGGGKKRLEPGDVRTVVRRAEQRRARVWAH